MKFDYTKLMPTEISDEFAYQLGEFLHNLNAVFDYRHIARVIRYEKTIINNYNNLNDDLTKSNNGD